MKPYIIGETAYHHEGDLAFLLKMIDDIAEMKLPAVKFHLLLEPGTYMEAHHPLWEATQKVLFTSREWKEIFSHTKQYDLDIIALCDDLEAVRFVNRHHSRVSAIELHSTSLNDYFMLNEIAEFPRQIILGVGGSTIDEIDCAVAFLRDKGKKNILLMYGFQSYPTDYCHLNMSKMLKLRDMFDLPVGYADHSGYDDENNIYISAMGAALGINILEKHYTPYPGVKRNDYHAAVGKEDMLKIRALMEVYLQAYGEGSLSMAPEELSYGSTGPMKKAIVARRNIKAGEILTLNNMWFKRTQDCSALKQYQFAELLGLKASADMEVDEIIDFTKTEYRFKRASFSTLTGGWEDEK
ncbi:MAG: N-acetylneuraminate synthase family protein [Syntrophomonas sp.]